MNMTSKSDTRDDLAALLKETRSVSSPFRTYLTELHKKYLAVRDGTIADYIPELARANPDHFAISFVTVYGKQFHVGDYQHRFTIQSISKPFVFGLALEKHGRDFVNTKVGVEPTGDAFNSLIRLDEKSKRPHNPMINAGAIATAGLIKGADSTDRLKQMLEMFRKYINHEPQVDVSVF